MMIIEFFGLSKSGKSILLNDLGKKGFNINKFNDVSILIKILFFIKCFFKYPLNTIYLFYKTNSNNLEIESLKILDKIRIFLMRNSYVFSMLAKSERLKNKSGIQFVDEYSLQSLFMILQVKSDKKTFQKIFSKLPLADYVFLFERDKKERHKIYRLPHPKFKKNPVMFPGGWININFSKKWMEVMEFNYKIIKEIILEDYTKEKNKFKNEGITFSEVYHKSNSKYL